MALQLRLPISSSKTLDVSSYRRRHSSPAQTSSCRSLSSSCSSSVSIGRSRRARCVPAGKEETRVEDSETADSLQNATPEDLEYVQQIKRVLELLRKNRDMLFGEVKLTIMIEDPREAERKKLLGLEDAEEVTRDDLAAALDDVNEGRIPENRVALRLLAEELASWPNLEVEAPKKKPTKSLYARTTDTGVDPAEAARRLNLDWDTATEIDENDGPSEYDTEVPPAVGYGALYLVTALPLIIGISVVLILFYNSLQRLPQAASIAQTFSAKTTDRDDPSQTMPPRSEIPVAEDELYSTILEASDDHRGTMTTTQYSDATSYTYNKEKQISIDPISLKQPHNAPAAASSLIKPKFISASLPCSAASSPRSSATPSSLIMKNLKKWRNHSPPSPPPVATHHQQHSVALSRLKLLQRESLRRSKSCTGEGRSTSRPSIDQFDFAIKSTTTSHEYQSRSEDQNDDMQLDKGGSSSTTTDHEPPRRSNAEEFKCGALSCLFLPNFSIKAKQVKPRREEEAESEYGGNVNVTKINNDISRTVSLEKFECGSWASSAMVKEGERDDSLKYFFDLPMELIRGCGSGTNSPVTTAFVFEKKGVLKKNSSTLRRSSSHETSTSNRHVRFSTSPPTSYPSSPFCISPRLQKARAEFNAYLEEAQRA